jgi:nickel-dependent lactate racemase
VTKERENPAGVWAEASCEAGDAPLSEVQARDVLAAALSHAGLAGLAGKRVLVLIPDGTRTAPVPMMFRLLSELLEAAAALDFLVALGTHTPMDEGELSRLVGAPVRNGRAGRSRVLNHDWQREGAFALVGTISAAEVKEISGGRLSADVPVRLNRLVLDYDQLIVCGPVFPHEVAGFSGGNKYFFPGISGPEVINVTHWLGALLTSRDVIGVASTPVRAMIDRAASLISTPRMLLAMVMHGESLRGLFAGTMEGAWRAAAGLSARLDIVYVPRPFRRVLSILPAMYDDLWTGAKGMYKLDPAIADGGEVVLFAPHLGEVSYTHGRLIDQVGYHVRDYFLAQWDRFREFPWGVLAHSTHLRGAGTFAGGVERPRIRVTLATGIPEERCRRLGLGYMDPATVRVAEWEGREDEGVKVVHRAGEILYRLEPLPGVVPFSG